MVCDPVGMTANYRLTLAYRLLIYHVHIYYRNTYYHSLFTATFLTL